MAAMALGLLTRSKKVSRLSFYAIVTDGLGGPGTYSVVAAAAAGSSAVAQELNGRIELDWRQDACRPSWRD